MQKLTSEERQFYSLVGEAVLSNPFSDARAAIDLKISGRYDRRQAEKPVDAAIAEVHKRLKRLENRGLADLKAFHKTDRHLMKNTFLFDAFHRFVPAFDRLISDQLNAGEQSLSVSFASDFMTLLKQRGFSEKDAIRYFELFFQLRRAFFFIQHNLVGRSPCMRKLRESLWNNIFTHNIDIYDRFLWNRMEDFSTLILGPTGAGKGTAAVAIGRSGYIPFDEKKNCFVESFMRSFTSLNLSQFSPTLIESELFGHTKGAFTGAVEAYKGIFERSSAFGAIFLDEIGEVTESVQIKLLQVIQERTFTPVGSHRVKRFSGRVIAATNRPLEDIRSRGIMRDDFYYRLCSDVIRLPGLAQRIAEDPMELDDLLAHTVGRILGNASQEMTALLLKSIRRSPGTDYAWPGNVRELEQCVRRIMLKQTYAPEPSAERQTPEDRFCRDMMEGRLDARGLLAGYCRRLYRQHGSYEAVSRRIRLDRRTVKKYVHERAAPVR